MRTTLAILSLLLSFAFVSCSSDMTQDDNTIVKTSKSKSSITDKERQLIDEFDALMIKSIELEQKTTSLDNRAGRAAAEESYKAVRQEIVSFMDRNKDQISTMGVEATKEFKTIIDKAPWIRK